MSTEMEGEARGAESVFINFKSWTDVRRQYGRLRTSLELCIRITDDDHFDV